jgi:hypothetical protein
VKPDGFVFLAWLSMAGLYALLGGACAEMSTRWGVAVFLAAQAALTALIAGLMYLAQFVSFS